MHRDRGDRLVQRLVQMVFALARGNADAFAIAIYIQMITAQKRLSGIFSSARQISPELGVSSRLMQRKNVLLPKPDAPGMAITSPFCASREHL